MVRRAQRRQAGKPDLLAVNLSWDRAHYVQQVLSEIVAFREVIVESDELSEGDSA
jgi:hypothetical protein